MKPTRRSPPEAAVETLTAAITGTPQVSAALTAETSAAEGSTFQWLRDGKPIAKAPKTIYNPVAADIGKNLSVQAADAY